MLKVGKDVMAFIKAEATRASIKKPMVLLMDCGCMLNQESVDVDLREDRDEPGFEPYFERQGVRFLVSRKIRHLADGGRLEVEAYGGGRFKKLVFSPNSR